MTTLAANPIEKENIGAGNRPVVSNFAEMDMKSASVGRLAKWLVCMLSESILITLGPRRKYQHYNPGQNTWDKL